MLYDKPQCPVDGFEKAWIENALTWFEQKLGKDFISNKKIFIPSNYKFEYSYFDSHEAIQYFIEFICTYINADPSLIEFHLVWNGDIEPFESVDKEGESFGTFYDYNFNAEGKYEIVIEENTLRDFDGTFINLAYKLTYIKLLHQKIFTFENVYMVNYAMVLHGFEILMANAFVRTAQWNGFGYSAWSAKRFGLINHPMYGYMFAVLSKYRKEEENWNQYLCTDVKNFYAQAREFLTIENEEEAKQKNNSIYVKDEDVFFEELIYENGGIYLIAHLKDNKYEGVATFYHKNGTLWGERIYKDDRPFTVLSNYNRYGDIVEKGTLRNGNGTLYIYKHNGNLKTIEIYKDGIKISAQE